LYPEYPYFLLDAFEMRLIALGSVWPQKIGDPRRVIYLLGEANLLTFGQVLDARSYVYGLAEIVEPVI